MPKMEHEYFWKFKAKADESSPPELILYGDISKKRGGVTK